MCVYVCMCVRVYVLCVHVYVCMHVYECMCELCVCVCCVYVCGYVYVCMCCACMCAYGCYVCIVCARVCVLYLLCIISPSFQRKFAFLVEGGAYSQTGGEYTTHTHNAHTTHIQKHTLKPHLIG